jgi:hypothetical protein
MFITDYRGWQPEDFLLLFLGNFTGSLLYSSVIVSFFLRKNNNKPSDDNSPKK